MGIQGWGVAATLSFGLAAVGCSKEKTPAKQPAPDKVASTDDAAVATDAAPVITEVPFFTVVAECPGYEGPFAMRDTYESSPELVPADPVGVKLYKPGESNPFVTVKSVVDHEGRRWELGLDGCNEEFYGPLTTKPIGPIVEVGKPKKLPLSDEIVKLATDVWAKDHASRGAFVKADAQREQLATNGQIPCDFLEYVWQDNDWFTYSVMCIRGGVVVSRHSATADTGHHHQPGVKIVGAVDINGDGTPELLLDEASSYLVDSMSWLDISQEKAVEHLFHMSN